MSITPSGSIPVLGQKGQASNNPLVVLNEHLGDITNLLALIAGKTTGAVPHVYTQVPYQDAGHGKVWGTFCLGCTEGGDEFVYPCQAQPDNPIRPPQFFTIGDVFTPDEHGRLLKHATPST